MPVVLFPGCDRLPMSPDPRRSSPIVTIGIASGPLGYFGPTIAECRNDIDVRAYQIGCVSGQSFLLCLGVAEFDRNILTFDIA